LRRSGRNDDPIGTAADGAILYVFLHKAAAGVRLGVDLLAAMRADVQCHHSLGQGFIPSPSRPRDSTFATRLGSLLDCSRAKMRSPSTSRNLALFFALPFSVAGCGNDGASLGAFSASGGKLRVGMNTYASYVGSDAGDANPNSIRSVSVSLESNERDCNWLKDGSTSATFDGVPMAFQEGRPSWSPGCEAPLFTLDLEFDGGAALRTPGAAQIAISDTSATLRVTIENAFYTPTTTLEQPTDGVLLAGSSVSFGVDPPVSDLGAWATGVSFHPSGAAIGSPATSPEFNDGTAFILNHVNTSDSTIEFTMPSVTPNSGWLSVFSMGYGRHVSVCSGASACDVDPTAEGVPIPVFDVSAQ
jgi:hypothetical protein